MAEQDEQVQSLRTLVINFKGGRALLPNSTVVEVLPFATPLRMEQAPPWVVGAMLWRSRTMPLVSFERLVLRTSPGPGAHTRIVVVNALGRDPRLPNFGFLGTEAPRPISLSRDLIGDNPDAEPATPGVLAQVLLDGQEAIIPDMNAIEAVLSRVIRATV